MSFTIMSIRDRLIQAYKPDWASAELSTMGRALHLAVVTRSIQTGTGIMEIGEFALVYLSFSYDLKRPVIVAIDGRQLFAHSMTLEDLGSFTFLD